MSHREPSCWKVARSRAQRARSKGHNRIVVGLIFVMSLLLMFSATSPQPAFKQARRPHPKTNAVTNNRLAPKASQNGTHISHPGRYQVRPSMWRLVQDLRRPTSRAEAERLLLARIDDTDLRAWISGLIREDQICRLSNYARQGITEEAVLAAWQEEFDNERTAQADLVDEARTRALLLRALAEAENPHGCAGQSPRPHN